MLKKYIFSILLFSVFSGYSQIEDSIEKTYRSYFDLPRESMFIHTNKTTYLVGENIWFKTYAFDKLNKKPSVETKNIYMGLYDSIGNQIDKKLYLATKGSTDGAFEIDSTFTSGTYFLKATTKWMKNFKEDDSFTQKIEIINPKNVKEVKLASNEKEYDVQFLPEGGHLVADVRNSVGVKVLDDKGLGTRAKGVVYNAKKEQVANFETNFLGIGKLSFTPTAKEIYTAEIVLDNSKKVQVPITDIQPKGIGITVNNLRKDETVILLKTNIQTLPEISNNKYTLLIHQNGASSQIPIVFDQLEKMIVIPKKQLNHGVNIITLFEGKKPILERMFFCQKDPINPKINISLNKKKGDSISYVISSKLEQKQVLDLSVSVLPRQTKSYKPKHNIKSALLLKPYLRGTIESPQYYFNKPKDRKRAFDLDNLLITQGWSRYNWDDIFYNVPVLRHPFEKGIAINGRLNQKLNKVQSLMLFPTKLNGFHYFDVYENGDFSADNFYFQKGEVLKFTTINKSGKGRKPKIYVNIPDPIINDKLVNLPPKNFASYYSQNREVIPFNFFKDRVEKLDTIVIDARLDRVFKKKGPKFDGSIIKINDEKVKVFNIIADILETEKFFVYRGGGGIQQTLCSRGNCSQRLADPSPNISIVSTEKTRNGAPRPVLFFVEGVYVFPDQMNMFLTSGTLEYEDVYIDYSDNVVTPPGSLRPIREAIIVNLFLRRSDFKSEDLNNNRYKNILVTSGFEPKKQFYAPGYVSYEIEPFKEYGIIHWEPNLVIDSEGKVELKTINTGLKELSFYVEGIGSDGSIFSQIIHADSSNKKSLN